ncbi:MAG TPA: acylneuraminate cytidylyltransferase family protein [Pseudolabrys sp.]|jgi:CMP-N-acetylneuraminic acid synthetase|nr:acylneuraminate cytidylyltransferase family protein [Pseudolabrys sp.]
MPTSNEAARRHLAIIPARGGSKRLPRKNVIDFFGKPILAYTIAAAHEARLFDRILVSTEDKEIADIARRHGAEVDKRPAALGRDEATVTDVCLELLDRLERQGDRYGTLTVLYATAPLRAAEDIHATHALLEPGRCDFAMAVTEFQQPVHQALRRDAGGNLTPVFPDLVSRRAEAAGSCFAGNGSTYSVDVSAFRRERSFYGQPLRGHAMPPERSVDIDTASNLDLARHYGARLAL